MEQVHGRIAVVTGGGTGMGRELVRLLASLGCHVATCDVNDAALAESRQLAEATALDGAKVMTFHADVSNELDLQAFRDEIGAFFKSDCIHLLFNNAGIAGAGSFVTDERERWEKTFWTDWGGVYFSTRTFLPLLLAADEGHIVNTSSVNGFFASIGPTVAHTSYSAAKFAVKGFSEALITDLRLNAPHIRVSVVMPGHIGTSIVLNSADAHDMGAETMSEEDLKRVRVQLAKSGLPLDAVSDEDLRKGIQMQGEAFRDLAPMTAASAAKVIIDGVRANKWRIIVGDDAIAADEMVRADPESAYTVEFWEKLQSQGIFSGMPRGEE